MTLDKFVSGFKKAEDKNEYMEKNLKRKYIPIVEKMKIAEMAAKSAHTIGGVYEPHTTLGEMMFNLGAFEAYSGIEVHRIDDEGNVHTAEEYDKLAEAGVIQWMGDHLDDYWAFEECYSDAVSDIKSVETEPWAVMKREIGAMSQTIQAVGEMFVGEVGKHIGPKEIAAPREALSRDDA